MDGVPGQLGTSSRACSSSPPGRSWRRARCSGSAWPRPPPRLGRRAGPPALRGELVAHPPGGARRADARRRPRAPRARPRSGADRPAREPDCATTTHGSAACRPRSSDDSGRTEAIDDLRPSWQTTAARSGRPPSGPSGPSGPGRPRTARPRTARPSTSAGDRGGRGAPRRSVPVGARGRGPRAGSARRLGHRGALRRDRGRPRPGRPGRARGGPRRSRRRGASARDPRRAPREPRFGGAGRGPRRRRAARRPCTIAPADRVPRRPGPGRPGGRASAVAAIDTLPDRVADPGRWPRRRRRHGAAGGRRRPRPPLRRVASCGVSRCSDTARRGPRRRRCWHSTATAPRSARDLLDWSTAQVGRAEALRRHARALEREAASARPASLRPRATGQRSRGPASVAFLRDILERREWQIEDRLLDGGGRRRRAAT